MDRILRYIGELLLTGWELCRIFPVLWVIFAALNIFSFVLFFIDKQCAKAEKRRIPERVLIGSAFFGFIGAVTAMAVFHHKTRKGSFKLRMALAFVLKLAFNAVMLVIAMNTIVAFD
ncbi:MAG: DUF1294 domain-containing protein [Oscillospiraceae bacterium]|nr:DUF1294 domain-containing protein [Oscillospiraceae bacterium]